MSRFMKTTIVVGLLLAFGSTAYAQVQPEHRLKYRQGVMRAVAFQWGPLTGVAKGEAEWGPAMAQKAANLAALAVIAEDVFPEASKGLANSDAKPEIWAKPDDFKAKMTAFKVETAKLADLAKAGNVEAIKAQINATGKTCGGCHDDYRVKR
ncbi:MAG: cytochrome c [Rhodospirillales bacterium]|nr:cytochrome c [Rhodospirillales bacterium]